jgi:imidazolonepropionase-like amidohydrolase
MRLFKTIGLALLTLLVAAGIWLAFESTNYPAVLTPPRDEPRATLIENVRVVSMAPGAPEALESQSVLVIDGAIAKVGPSGKVPAPIGVRVIDGRGRTLLPGLIDAHVHLWDEAELAGYLAHGVTSIRNMSGLPFHLPLVRRIAARRILGPDLVTTGPILNSPGPNEQPIQKFVVTAAEARAAVRAQAAAGYDTIKLYSNLTPEAYAAILAEARTHRLRIVGHTPEGVRHKGIPHERPFEIAFEDVLDDGYVTIEHTESIVWHGLRDRLDEQAMAALAKRIAASGVVVTPTLTAHANLVHVAESRGAFLKRPGVETINPLLRSIEADTYAFWSRQNPQAREAPRAAFYLVATRLMHEAGVPLIAGSDAGIFTNIPGSELTRELELLVKAGLTPFEALAAATVKAGPPVGLPDRGQIAPGYRANLILVSGDPLTNVSVVENPEAVMIGGIWLDATALADLRKGATQTSIARSALRGLPLLWQ